MVGEHKWYLVGPWYRWHSEEDPHGNKRSRPILQKYPDSDLVEQFLKNPQHSLKYLDEDQTAAKRRKIFLDTHSRFYLVVCALHCDSVGFPKVKRDRVCEAGFVVRRRQTPIPEDLKPEVESLLRDIAYQKARLKKVQGKRKQAASGGLGNRLRQGVDSAIACSKQGAGEKFGARLNQSRQTLSKLLLEAGVETVVEGWRQSAANVGNWIRQDDETPETVSERIYPLYPLIPDAADAAHPSGQQSLWYGLLPVGSAAVDADANPQFDDRSVYEVRCFVRHHRPQCPKTNERNDCKGDLVWSSATEAYQLAPHFDLLGTSNRTTTIQAPDLRALQEQVEDPNFQMGQGLGMAIATPPGSGLPIETDADGNPKAGTPSAYPSICFFAIPLITIVAMFLLRLFLPIVVFLFGLWFLLRLKLCILPTVDIDLGAELDAGLEGELALQADLDLAVKARLDLEVLPTLPSGMQQSIKDMSDQEEAYRVLARIAIDQALDFSGSGVAPDIVRQLADDPGLPERGENQRASLPDPAARLQYYETKSLREVLA